MKELSLAICFTAFVAFGFSAYNLEQKQENEYRIQIAKIKCDQQTMDAQK